MHACVHTHINTHTQIYIYIYIHAYIYIYMYMYSVAGFRGDEAATAAPDHVAGDARQVMESFRDPVVQVFGSTIWVWPSKRNVMF